MTFRGISILVFLVMLGGIGLHAFLFPFSPSRRWGLMDIIRVKVHAFTLLFVDQRMNAIGKLKKLVLLLALLSFLVLLVTGFGPLLFGYRLAGWLLMIHATFAPILIGCVSLLALGWAQGMVFRDSRDALLKLSFWGVIFLSLPLMLSIILSMFPFFGTDGQAFLLSLHRWLALLFVCIALLFFYLLIRRQIVMETRQEEY